jgi:peroxiredoxin
MKSRMRRLLLAIALLVTALNAAQASDTRPAPNYSAQTVDGKTISIESYRGQVVLFAFIYTECPHCQKVSQMLQRLQEAYGEKDVQPFIVAINPDAATRLPAFVEKLAIKYPIAIDTQPNARKFMGIPATGWVMTPALVIIDREGTIRFEHAGNDPAVDDEPALRALIDTLVAKTQSSTKP